MFNLRLKFKVQTLALLPLVVGQSALATIIPSRFSTYPDVSYCRPVNTDNHLLLLGNVQKLSDESQLKLRIPVKGEGPSKQIMNWRNLFSELEGGFEVGNGGDAYIAARDYTYRFNLLDFEPREYEAPFTYMSYYRFADIDNLACLGLKEEDFVSRLGMISSVSNVLAAHFLDYFNSTSWFFLEGLKDINLKDEGKVIFPKLGVSGLYQAAIRYRDVVAISNVVYRTGGRVELHGESKYIFPMSETHRMGLVFHELIQGVLDYKLYEKMQRGEVVRELTRKFMGTRKEIYQACEMLNELNYFAVYSCIKDLK